MDHETFKSLPEPVALVVDDEPLILMDTSDIMANVGYHVIEARNADEAFEFLKRHSSLKLVFTDIQMPGEIDGVELAHHIANRWPAIKVIVASGAVRPAPGVLPENATFLNKPISVQLVHQTLKEYFGQTMGV